MILNQAHPVTRDVSSTAASFLNKSKTSFDIASLVSPESSCLSKDMSPHDILSPDDQMNKVSGNKFTYNERWHPYQDVKRNLLQETHSTEMYHGHKKYRRHQRNRDDGNQSPISPKNESPKSCKQSQINVADKKTSSSPQLSPSFSHSERTASNSSSGSALPISSHQSNIPESQLLKAMAAGVLPFPFSSFAPLQSSMKSFVPFVSSHDSENTVTNSDVHSPKLSPAHTVASEVNSFDVTTKSSGHRDSRSSTSPSLQSILSQESTTNSVGYPSLPSTLISPSVNSDIDCLSRQALFQAAAASSTGFPSPNSLPGLQSSFVAPCFPRIPSSPTVGTTAFDPTANMSLRNAFCPPHPSSASYNPWLLRQAAASVRQFPPHLAGEICTF